MDANFRDCAILQFIGLGGSKRQTQNGGTAKSWTLGFFPQRAVIKLRLNALPYIPKNERMRRKCMPIYSGSC